jgi:hypothetical protein
MNVPGDLEIVLKSVKSLKDDFPEAVFSKIKFQN